MTYTVKQLSERYGVSLHTVLSWIDSGHLAALNVARNIGGRPRYRVTQESLDSFERLRSSTPTPTTKKRRKSAAPAGPF